MQLMLFASSSALGGFLTGLLITWGNIRMSAILACVMGVAVLLAVLADRFPRLDRGMRAFFDLWERVVPWLLVIVGPVGLAYWIVRGGLFGMPLWLQAVVLAVWGVALGGMIWVLAWPDERKQSFAWLSDLNAWAPFLYAFNLAAIATVFFAACATLAVRAGGMILSLPLGVAASTDPDVLHGRLMDFFVWHFLDAVPALKINEALQWKVPLAYDGWMLGLLLISFKIAVIGPTVAAFMLYWKESRGKADALEAAAARATVEQC